MVIGRPSLYIKRDYRLFLVLSRKAYANVFGELGPEVRFQTHAAATGQCKLQVADVPLYGTDVLVS